MNLYGTIHHEEVREKAYWYEQALYLLKYSLNHFLNLLGVAVFWLYMLALLVAPFWVPLVVNRLYTH